MSLTSDQIKKVAKLANIPITSEEEEKYTEQLSKVLDYVELLDKVDTKGTDTTFNATPNNNITREDLESKSLTQDESIANAPQVKNGMFLTKGVFEE